MFEQAQQQQKKPVLPNASSRSDFQAPAGAFIRMQPVQASPFPSAAAPSAFASQSAQQADASRPFNFSHIRDVHLNAGTVQAGVVNQPPSHYALPQGQVVYLQGDAAASMSSLGPLPVLVGPSAASSNIVPTNASVLHPTMSVSPANRSPAVAYYVQAASPQQQQQQQHTLLLNSGSSFQRSGNANTNTPYILLPAQHMDHTSMAALAAYTPVPFAAYVPRPSSSQDTMQHANGFAMPNMAMTAWSTAPAPHHAHSPILHSLPTTLTIPDEKTEILGDGSSQQQTASSSEVPSTASASLRLQSSISSIMGKSTSSAKQRQSLMSDSSGTQGSKEKSAASQPTSSTQGLPYSEDPVEIDTTKRQLIVNYLPQRLTYERFKALFRPYGELMEEESRIIYDFRRKMATATATKASSGMDQTPPSVPSEDDTISTEGSAAAVTACRVPRSKGYGFIYYKDGASTERAIKELNGKEVDGKRIKVRYAQQQRSLDTRPVDAEKGNSSGVKVQTCSGVCESEAQWEAEIDGEEPF
ncbi:putative RNA-binding protein 4 [Leptomonas seymouri]|uniref:Putative RNA-binding protein 4 n=1 Tax=Leptomonas seymouri TaxID=5684 RepID=A0A0N1IA87_LEPSE|nr:putative RNA-binding protein 4 [Leptomonas seymouri]|eukprot:KPI89172.1 putative RNA-binding protein 4 [Leptomonas seymouri]